MFRRLSVMALLVFLVGCGADDEPVADPAPVSAPATAGSGDPAGSGEQAGVQACGLLKKAVADATLMEPGVVETIRAAGAPADAPVSDAASRLATAYAAAVASRGTATEPDAVAAVSARGAEMTRTCTAAGLEGVG